MDYKVPLNGGFRMTWAHHSGIGLATVPHGLEPFWVLWLSSSLCRSTKCISCVSRITCCLYHICYHQIDPVSPSWNWVTCTSQFPLLTVCSQLLWPVSAVHLRCFWSHSLISWWTTLPILGIGFLYHLAHPFACELAYFHPFTKLLPQTMFFKLFNLGRCPPSPIFIFHHLYHSPT